MDVLVGAGTSVVFELQSPGGALPADVGTVTYSLYNTAGTLVSGPTAVTTTPQQTEVVVAISGSNNTIDPARRFEKRTVVLNWQSAGRTYSRQISYRVLPFLNITVGPADVRSVLSLGDDELQDSEIDVSAAYFRVEDELTKEVLDAALASGTATELAINRAIACDAALPCLTTLELRASASLSDGVQKVSRFSSVNFAEIAQRVRDERAGNLAIVTGVDLLTPTLATLTTPTDVITGA